ncbi:hypothetical protein L0337_38525 [candidate division KSB1 bacterium]|nr:hypothetical protein [candidate division KSB1 bacterium]
MVTKAFQIKTKDPTLLFFKNLYQRSSHWKRSERTPSTEALAKERHVRFVWQNRHTKSPFGAKPYRTIM